MYEPWIFATTLAAGGGLVAYAVTLPPQQYDLPSIAPEPAAAVHLIAPPPPVRVIEPTPPPNPVLQLDPVVIQARLHPFKPAAQPAATPPAPEPAPDQTADRPCSDWRSLGPTHVVSGNPSGELAVRSLCP